MVPTKDGASVDLLTWATRNGHSEVEQFLTEKEGAQIAETPQPASEEEGGQEEAAVTETETDAKEEGKEEDDAREEGDGAEDTTEAVEGAGGEEPPAVSSDNIRL